MAIRNTAFIELTRIRPRPKSFIACRRPATTMPSSNRGGTNATGGISKMASQKISLLLADVDGTLVDSNKVVTPRAKEAIRRLREKQIDFAVTSGRPPRGMRMITEAIPLTAPVAAFNGGMIVRPNDLVAGPREPHARRRNGPPGDGAARRRQARRLGLRRAELVPAGSERAAQRQGGAHGPVSAHRRAGFLARALRGRLQDCRRERRSRAGGAHGARDPGRVRGGRGNPAVVPAPRDAAARSRPFRRRARSLTIWT